MRYFIFFLFALFFLACESQTSEEMATPPNIEIQVKGISSGTAFLIGVFTDQQFKVDSAQIDATGKMVFSRAEPYKKGFCVVFLPNNQTIQILLDTDQIFSMKTQVNSMIPAMQVEGSVDNDLLYQNLKFQIEQQPKFTQVAQQMKEYAEGSPEFNAIKEQEKQLVVERKAHLNELFTKYPNSFFTTFKKAGQNPDTQDVRNPDETINSALQVYLYRTEFWNDVDFKDERLLYTPIISNKLSRYIKELTPQHPDSIKKSAKVLIDKVLDSPEYFKYFANWITLNYEPTKTTLMDPEAVYVFMVQNYFTHELAFWSDSVEVFALQQRANEMAGSLIGHKALDVKSTDINGQQRSIYEITAPYIVIFMYNPDCDHCQEESPKLVQFYREWKSKEVEIFTIALDTEESAWRSFVQSSGLPGIHVFDPTNKSIYGKYYVDNTPEIYVLNPDRTIIGKNLKVEQIATIINKDKGQ